MPYACPVCNNEEYDEDDGLFFCTECGTQSQELIVQEAAVSTDISARHEVRGAKGESDMNLLPKANLGRPWTIYEAYQVIILSQADSLIALGAREDLKEIVFTIWANYLSKLGVAFCNKEKLVPDVVTEMRVGRQRELYRGTLNNPLNRHKKPFHEQRFSEFEGSNTTERNTVPFIIHGSTQDIFEDDFKRAAEAGALSGEEFYDEDRPEDNADDNIVFLNEDDESSDECQELEGEGAGRKSARYRKAIKSPEWMTMKKTLAFCYVGLMFTDHTILPFDVVRWVYEGKVPFLSATHLLPEDMVLSAGDQTLFETGRFDTAVFITEINRLLVYLELDNMPSPELSELIPRFVVELSLPDEVETMCQQLTKRIPFVRNDYKIFYKRQEVLAVSYIILALKLTFGLDDSREWALSEYSQEVQALVKSDYKVFIWDSWKKFMAVKSSQEFSAFKEFNKDLSKSNVQHLNQLLECYARAVDGQRKITIGQTLNRHQRTFRKYKSELRDAIRKPLEIALDSYVGEKGNTGEQDWSEAASQFSSSRISHLTDVPTFQTEIRSLSPGKEKDFKKLVTKYSVLETQVAQYQYLRDAVDLPTNRHDNYMWLLRLASQTIDCEILDLDKLVVRLTDYLVKTATDKDSSGLVCCMAGMYRTSTRYARRRKKDK